MIKKSAVFLIMILWFSFMPQGLALAGEGNVSEILSHSLIMAANSPIYIINGTVKEYTRYPKVNGNNILVCADTASAELQFQNDSQGEFVSLEYFEDKGFTVYQSTTYQFVILGNQFTISPEYEERIIKLFGIYVSENGKDTNSGYPNAPVATFEKAQTLYREYKTTYGDGYANTIFIHKGIYRRNSSIILSAEDSGMNIKNFGDGDVSFRGSVRLPKSGFTLTQDENILSKLPNKSSGSIYQIELQPYIGKTTPYPEYAVQTSSTSYYELYVNSAEQTLARWPNQDWALTGSALSDNRTFKFDNTRVFRWADSPSAMLFGYWKHNWACQPIFIDNINTDKGQLTLKKEPNYGLSAGMRYYAFNLLEELDVPGEWYIDTNTDILYYYPTDGFLSNSIELTNCTSDIFRLENVLDIKIEGINVELTRGNGIRVTGESSNVNISNCNVRNIGNSGISLGKAANSSVSSCNIYNIGGTGVSLSGGNKLSLTPGNSKVENCNIYNFGRIFRTYQGGVNLDGVGNKVIHNSIHDSPHLAIKLGGNDNVIEYNEIYNVVKETSDSGAIYTGRNWTNLGNIIKYNYFHDIKRDPTLTSFMASSVYIDDMTGGTQVTENVFENCSQAALFGGGRHNTFSDNILIDCDNSIDYDARAKIGGWAHDSTLPGGAVYEGLMGLIQSNGYDSTLWEGKYTGFAELVSDAIRQASGEMVDAGLPKGGVVTNNYHYGPETNRADYENINESVIAYGIINGNVSTTEDHTNQDGYGNIPFEEIGLISTPEWDAGVHLAYPRNNTDITGTNVELAWAKTGGAESYQITLSKNSDLSAPIYQSDQKKTGYLINHLETGTYYWRVKAINNDFGIIESEIYCFEVAESISENSSVFALEDFENHTTGSVAMTDSWQFSVASGDSLTIEDDELGSRALKFVRKNTNLLSGSSTSAKLKLDKTTSSGKIRVSYDTRLENYRSTLRNWGSVLNTGGSGIMRLLSHSAWIYGVTTSGYNHTLASYLPSDYITVERIIDLDNSTYDIKIFKNGELKSKQVGLSCGKGEAGYILFEVGYQSPYEVYNGEGDAVYWVDNIKVDRGDLSIYKTSPQNGEMNVDIDKSVEIIFNTEINANTITTDTIQILENNTKIANDKYSISTDGNKSIIDFLHNLKYNSNYTIKIDNNILPLDTNYNPMQIPAEIKFKTKPESGKSVYALVDFEKNETGSFTSNTNWQVSVANGDLLSIEKDEYGSKALKFTRSASNLNSQSSTTAKLMFDSSVSSGKIRVTYDTRLENYRSTLKQWGSVLGQSGIIMNLFSHSRWLYGITTSGYNHTLTSYANSEYITVERIIDLDNGLYDITIYQGDIVKSRQTGLACIAGEAGMIEFEVGYQNPYEVYSGEGDAIYWVDNIKVDRGFMSVYQSTPENGATNVEAINRAEIIFNTNLNADTVNTNTIKLIEYGIQVPKSNYSVEAENNIIYVLYETVNNMEYSIIVTTEVLSSDIRCLPMQTQYKLTFSTKPVSNITSLAYCDFEELEEGTTWNTPGTHQHNNWSFTLMEGDSIKVDRDPFTGSKALKVIKGDTTDDLNVSFNFGLITDGKAVISFDTRIENDSRKLVNWGSVLDDNSNVFIKLFAYQGGYWHNRIGDTIRYLCGISGYNQEYLTVEEILDIKNKQYTVKGYKDGVTIFSKSESSGNNPISKLNFKVNNVADQHRGKGVGAGIYWLDNISVKQLAYPEISSTYPKANEKNIETDTQVKLLFGTPVLLSSLNKSNIVVYKNHAEISKYDYEISMGGINEVIVRFSKNLDFNASYMVKVSGVKNLSKYETEMPNEYILSFSTTPKARLYDARVNSQEIGKATLSANIKSYVPSYVFIVEIVDETGILKMMDINTYTNSDVDFEKEYTLSENTENSYFKCYLWESIENLNPIGDKIIVGR